MGRTDETKMGMTSESENAEETSKVCDMSEIHGIQYTVAPFLLKILDLYACLNNYVILYK